MNNLRASTFCANKRQLKNIKRQGGWTFWSLLFVLLTVFFFEYVGMQLAPIFAENKVVRMLQNQLYLDGSHALLDYKTDLKVTRSRKKFIIETHYRREIHLFFNIGVFVTFDNVVEKNLGIPE